MAHGQKERVVARRGKSLLGVRGGEGVDPLWRRRERVKTTLLLFLFFYPTQHVFERREGRRDLSPSP